MNIFTGFIPPLIVNPPHTKTYIRGAISNSGKHYMFAITLM